MTKSCVMLSRRCTQKVSCLLSRIGGGGSFIIADGPVKTSLLSWLPAPPAVDQSMDVDPTPTPSKAPVTEPVPEGEIYICLLILHHLHKTPETHQKSIELAHETVDKMQALNRRSMDPIAAKVWYAFERSYELGGQLADARP